MVNSVVSKGLLKRKRCFESYVIRCDDVVAISGTDFFCFYW